MKKMLIALMMMFVANAFASNLCNNPTHNHNLKLNINEVETMTIVQNDDNNKEIVLQGDEETEAVDMKDVRTISLKGKNPDDKVSFYINGEKKSYKVSEIKSIKIRTVERAN